MTITFPLSIQSLVEMGTGELSGYPDEILGRGEGWVTCNEFAFHTGE